jgi:hypothetical protein
MRSASLAAAVLLLLLAPAAARPRMATVRYTPPAQPGDIFTVIDYAREGGEATTTLVTEVMGSRRRAITIGAPYAECVRAMPAGAVVRFRHFTADPTPLTFSTTGSIVHGPYQGGVPLEALHRCYQLVS